VSGDCSWWSDPASEPYRFLRDFGPDVVLVQDSINEIPDRLIPEWDQYRSLGDPVFGAWLDSEYREAFGVFGGGARVVLTNAPCVDWEDSPPWDEIDDGEGRIALLNEYYRSLESTVQVADIHTQICPDGEFSDTVMGVRNARPDGFHLSDNAAVTVADRWLGPLLIEAGRA
jgi:hypothetical protein